jgi:hypothetical protein
MEQNQVCYFAWLPSEVLKVVANGAGGQALASLWRSCNRNINRKLASPSGVDIFELYMPNRARLEHWPQLICQLQGLKTLRVELRKDVGAAPIFCSTLLATLPASLQEITFHFREAEECWLRPFERKDGSPFQPDLGVDFNFAEHFPELHTLKLVAPSPVQNLISDDKLQAQQTPSPIYGLLRNSSLSLLPRSLTCLELPSNNIISASGFKGLPKSLETLNLAWLGMKKPAVWGAVAAEPDMDLDTLSTLPLRTLNLSRFNNHLPAGFFKALPLTLTSLKLTNHRKPLHESFSLLPANLLHLDLEFTPGFTAQHFSLLPRQLTYLNNGTLQTVSDAELLHLPSTLTHLDLYNAKLSNGSSMALLPPNLRTLCLGNWAAFKTSDLAGLPRSITHLDLSSSANLTNAAFDHLPPGLVTFILFQNTQIDGSCVSAFPKSLHTFLTTPRRFVRIDQMHGFQNQAQLWEETKRNGDAGWISGYSTALRGQLEALQWLNNNGYSIKCNKYPVDKLVSLAKTEGHLDTAKWLSAQKALY